jgi:hypothetical protein
LPIGSFILLIPHQELKYNNKRNPLLIIRDVFFFPEPQGRGIRVLILSTSSIVLVVSPVGTARKAKLS